MISHQLPLPPHIGECQRLDAHIRDGLSVRVKHTSGYNRLGHDLKSQIAQVLPSVDHENGSGATRSFCAESAADIAVALCPKAVASRFYITQKESSIGIRSTPCPYCGRL